MHRRHFVIAAGASIMVPYAVEADTPKRVVFDPTPQTVRIKSSYASSEVVVLPRSFYLYWVQEPGIARRYGVGVGKAGLEFTGSAIIERKRKWPSWRPTASMIEREPHKYTEFIGTDYIKPGGPGNPLGARALYLYQNGIDTYFRIHGTTQPRSIGQSASSGCIRMLNEHVSDLYDRIPIGTKVTVL